MDLIASGEFGLLHFACQNTYYADADPSIKLGGVQFTPTLMTTAAIHKALARFAPTVFISTCRSAGLVAIYNRLDRWASKFLEAGVAALIGPLWTVRNEAAHAFALGFCGQLQSGRSPGEATMLTRATITKRRP